MIHTCCLHSTIQPAKEQSQLSLSFAISVINKQGRGGECCRNDLLKAYYTENHHHQEATMQISRQRKWLDPNLCSVGGDKAYDLCPLSFFTCVVRVQGRLMCKDKIAFVESFGAAAAPGDFLACGFLGDSRCLK